MSRDLRLMMRYSAWANERLFAALAALPPDVITATRPTGTATMLSTLGHAHVVDLIWKAHLEGRPHGFTTRQPEATTTLEALRKDQVHADAWYVDYADRLGAAEHGEVVSFQFVGGGSGAMTRGDMLLHVANHKTYHRGYVAEMLYQRGLKPPTMDLPVFLRDFPPSL